MGEINRDKRIEYIREYTLTSMRLKIDKWNKIIISDEQRSYLLAFVDKPEPQQMVISQNIAGHLQIHTDWPSPMRNKGVFFVKKEKKPMPAENFDFAEHMAVGDIYPNVLDYLCSWVEEVLVPIFNNPDNMKKFPSCIAYDIEKQVHELATAVYQIRGHIKGLTLLPFPQGADNIDNEERKVRESHGKDVDTVLKNNIEAIVSKWAYQIDEVLTKDSAEEIEKGNNPGPMTEIQFWKAKCENLESLYDQMKLNTTKKMASILNITDSAYYPSFKSMFRNVLSALNEALDITLHLHPLIEHFQGIENADYTELRPLLAPLMHTVCLVYANSGYYNTTARIMVLLQIHTCKRTMILIPQQGLWSFCRCIKKIFDPYLQKHPNP